jgi:ribose transport system substrate-binding protein
MSHKLRNTLVAAVLGVAIIATTACASGTTAPSGADTTGGPSTSAGGKIVIGQSIPTLDNPWYVEFVQGSKDAADKLGVEIHMVTNPETNPWDPASQMAVIENLIATRPDVLQIDPTSTDGINGVIDEARKQGIPVVTDGIHVSTEVEASVVADNKQGGKLAGEWVAKTLGDGGDIAVLEGEPGRDIVQQRQDGFKEGVAANPAVKIVSSQVADHSREGGQRVTENVIQANPDIKLIWGAADTMALGSLEALKTRDLLGKVMVGGFDGAPEAFEAVKAGNMSFTIDQVPYEEGVVSIVLAYLIATGGDYEKEVLLDTTLVDSTNVADYLDDAAARHTKVLADIFAKYDVG